MSVERPFDLYWWVELNFGQEREDDEHLIETVYYIHLKPIVLSDVCNLNKYENLYITEMIFI